MLWASSSLRILSGSPPHLVEALLSTTVEDRVDLRVCFSLQIQPQLQHYIDSRPTLKHGRPFRSTDAECHGLNFVSCLSFLFFRGSACHGLTGKCYALTKTQVCIHIYIHISIDCINIDTWIYIDRSKNRKTDVWIRRYIDRLDTFVYIQIDRKKERKKDR